MFYHVFRAGSGYAGLAAGDKGLLAVFLPDEKRAVLNAIRLKYPQAKPSATFLMKKAAALLREYFKGEKVDFSGVNCDLSALKPFARMVLKKTCSIPYGRTASYKWVGRGKARAAGNALGSNPVPVIIPCHRVIKSDNSYGGFAYGVKWKKKLLEMEAGNCKG